MTTPVRQLPSKDWGPTTVTNITGPQTVAEEDSSRNSITVVALSSNPVDTRLFAGTSDGINPSTSKYWQLAPGEGLVIPTIAAVTACSVDGVTAVGVKVVVTRGTACP